MLQYDKDWVKAAASAQGGNCVEVRLDGAGVHVRNSRMPDGNVLTFTPDEWRAFTAGVRDEEFDLS
jgi:hypothetical protein